MGDTVLDPEIFVGKWWTFLRLSVRVSGGKELSAKRLLELLIEGGVFRTRAGGYLERVCVCRGKVGLGRVFYGVYVGDRERVNVKRELLAERVCGLSSMSRDVIGVISSEVEYVRSYIEAGRFSFFGDCMMGKGSDEWIGVDLRTT